MSDKIRILSITAALMLLLSATVLAAGAGSLTIVDICDGVTLYQVAAPDGTLTEPFADAPVTDLTDEKSVVRNAELLADYARANGIPGQIITPDESGTVRYDRLPEGLYLILSNTDPVEFNPFLVAIPTVINGEVIYDVEAAPKAEEPPTEPTEPSDPTAPTGPSGPTDPSAPTDPTDPSQPPDEPDIPVTGVVQWPKYLMLAAGLLLVLLGTADLVKGREAK